MKHETDNPAQYIRSVQSICELIELHDTDKHNISTLAQILQKKQCAENKQTVIDLLLTHSKNSKKARAANIFLNEAEILQGKTILTSKPRELQIMVTSKCNLQCIMCNAKQPYGTYEISDKVYEYLKNNIYCLEKISWKGGEVFLYKDFDTLMNLAAKHNVHQTIITNGLLLNDERIKLISRHNIELMVSIDAPDKQLYETIRVGGNFDNLLKVLTALQKEQTANGKFTYSMATVLTSLNYHLISELVDFAYSYGFNLVHFFKCAPTQFNEHLMLNSNHFPIIAESIKNKIDEMNNKAGAFQITTDVSFTGNRDVDNLTVNTPYTEYNIFCLTPWKSLIMDTDNITFGCNCRNIKVGHYASYEDIWNCSELIEYRKTIMDKGRQACKLVSENTYA
jgi:MoaA/NifB/PqqE/SkfB family radical SAM enzyme